MNKVKMMQTVEWLDFSSDVKDWIQEQWDHRFRQESYISLDGEYMEDLAVDNQDNPNDPFHQFEDELEEMGVDTTKPFLILVWW